MGQSAEERAHRQSLLRPRLDRVVRDQDRRGGKRLPHRPLAPRRSSAGQRLHLRLRRGHAPLRAESSGEPGPRSLRPGPPGSGYYRTAPDARWHLFLSLEGRAVARNILLDGNTFTDSQSVDKYPFVGEARMGIAMTFGHYRLTYAQAFRTRQFHGQNPESFGSLSISTDF